MPRKPRPLRRDDGRVRDASLIVIASEDQYAVAQYFHRFRTTRVQFEVLPTEDMRSAPAFVFERLQAFRRKYEHVDGDTFWLCIDRDRWPENLLNDVMRACLDEGFQSALSNPSFELWLLLHFVEQPPSGQPSAREIEAALRAECGGYTKANGCVTKPTEEQVALAIARAERLDRNAVDPPSAMYPIATKTLVYKILQEMLKKDMIRL